MSILRRSQHPPKKRIKERLPILAEGYEKRYLQAHPREVENLENLKEPTVKPFPKAIVNLTNKQITKIFSTATELSCICGAIMGDARLDLDSGYKTYRVKCRHSTRQADYFFWKQFVVFQNFTESTKADRKTQYQLPDGYQNECKEHENIIGSSPNSPFGPLGKLSFITNVSPKFNELAKFLKDGKNKIFERSWLNAMNAWFLVVLWLDDGGLTGRGDHGKISFGLLPEAQVMVFIKYLEIAWGVKGRYSLETSAKTGEYKYSVVMFDPENLQKFLRIIAPLIPVESMLYKICFFHENDSIRQRWVSELDQLVTNEDFKLAIKEIYAQKELKYYVSQSTEKLKDI